MGNTARRSSSGRSKADRRPRGILRQTERGDTVVKIVLIGLSGGQGMTTLVRRYIDDRFVEPPPPTIGVDFAQKRVIVEKKSVLLQIIDTNSSKAVSENHSVGCKRSAAFGTFTAFAAGAQCRPFLSMLLSDASAAIIVFDLSQHLPMGGMSSSVAFPHCILSPLPSISPLLRTPFFSLSAHLHYSTIEGLID